MLSSNISKSYENPFPRKLNNNDVSVLEGSIFQGFQRFQGVPRMNFKNVEKRDRQGFRIAFENHVPENM